MCVPMPMLSFPLQMSGNPLKGGGDSKSSLEKIILLLVLISGAQLHEGIIIVSPDRSPLTLVRSGVSPYTRGNHICMAAIFPERSGVLSCWGGSTFCLS